MQKAKQKAADRACQARGATRTRLRHCLKIWKKGGEARAQWPAMFFTEWGV